jgi:hypothetical protein
VLVELKRSPSMSVLLPVLSLVPVPLEVPVPQEQGQGQGQEQEQEQEQGQEQEREREQEQEQEKEPPQPNNTDPHYNTQTRTNNNYYSPHSKHSHHSAHIPQFHNRSIRQDIPHWDNICRRGEYIQLLRNRYCLRDNLDLGYNRLPLEGHSLLHRDNRSRRRDSNRCHLALERGIGGAVHMEYSAGQSCLARRKWLGTEFRKEYA